MKNFSLEGKIAFVTGASYGIGFAIASAYAAAGATIVFNDINQELVNKGLACLRREGHQGARLCLRRDRRGSGAEDRRQDP